MYGLNGRWTYFLHIVPDISDLLVSNEFISAITGRSVGKLERKLFTLPMRLRGLIHQQLLALSLKYLVLL